MTKMIINDLNFIEIKTKKSPTSCALNSITAEKLKPYYNTVYQLFKIKNKPLQSFEEAKHQIESEINEKIPEIIKNRRINQETHGFKISKPYEKRRFNSETLSSKKKKCKSVTKSFFVTNEEYSQHKQKDELGEKFEELRKISKTFSESTMNNKKKYNMLDKYYKIIDHHYKALELEARFIGGDEHEENMITKNKENRYKIEGNKWIEGILVENDEEHDSLMRKEKTKYFHKLSNSLNLYKGVHDKDVQECKEIIEQDQELMSLSLSHTIATTNISEVKSMYEMTKSRLTDLMNQHRSRNISLKRSEPRETKSCRLSRKTYSIEQSPDYKEYKSEKKSQNENPETYRIGDRYSNFRSKEEKKGMMLKLKEHQKIKYTTKVMDLNLHRKLFLKNK